MNVANIDDVLFDFLASSTDYGTFLNHWHSIKRQFSLRGLIIDEQNFPKMISLVDRQKARRKPPAPKTSSSGENRPKKGKQGKSETARRGRIKQKENVLARRAEDAADYYFLNIIDQEIEATKKQAKNEKDEKRQQRRENREKRINERNLKESETVPSQSEWAPGTLGKYFY